jgi:hypothetical protein
MERTITSYLEGIVHDFLFFLLMQAARAQDVQPVEWKVFSLGEPMLKSSAPVKPLPMEAAVPSNDQPVAAI